MSLIKRLSLDFVMALLIVLEFAYRLTGSTLHELVGLTLLALFVSHGACNWRWFANLLKGRYAKFSVVTTTVNALLVTTAVLMIASGVLNSDLLFSLTQVELDLLPRALHTAAAYWLLILLGVHLGLHGKMIIAEVGKRVGISCPSRLRTLSLHVLWVSIAVYGIFASFARSVLSRLTAYYSFGDREFDESLLEFLVQHAAIVGLYALLSYQALQFFKRLPHLHKPPARTDCLKRGGWCKCGSRG